MTPDEPKLLPDGRVFPPVTPDPPAPPGQEEIVVPDLTFTSTGQPDQQGVEPGIQADEPEKQDNEVTPPPVEPSD